MSFHGENVVFPSKLKKKLTVSALAEAKPDKSIYITFV